MIQCNKNGCVAEARWKLSLRLFAAGNDETKWFPDADVGLNVCYEHGENPEVGDLLSLDNQKRILDGLEKAGARVLPDFSRTKFVLTSLYTVGQSRPARPARLHRK